MHYFQHLFAKILYMFRKGPLSIIRNYNLTTPADAMLVLLSFASVTTLADGHRTSLTETFSVYTVLLYCWCWTVDLCETRRVFYEIN
jgi:hypothetical protein